MPGANPVSLVAKQRRLSLKILRRKIWATAGNEPGSEALRYKNNKKCPLRADGPTRRCLVPRRLSFDENVRAKEGGKETTGLLSVPFPWSLAVHHQSLAFRARLCHAKNKAPEEEAVPDVRQ